MDVVGSTAGVDDLAVCHVHVHRMEVHCMVDHMVSGAEASGKKEKPARAKKLETGYVARLQVTAHWGCVQVDDLPRTLRFR